MRGENVRRHQVTHQKKSALPRFLCHIGPAVLRRWNPVYDRTSHVPGKGEILHESREM